MGLRPSCASRASRRCCCWCCRSIRAGLWVERHGVGAYGQSTRFHKQTIMATTRVLLILLSTHAPPAAARPPARLRSIACRAACHNGCVCDRIVINLPSHHVVWWALVGYCCCCIAAPALLPAPPGLLRSWWSEAATIDRTHHSISVPGGASSWGTTLDWGLCTTRLITAQPLAQPMHTPHRPEAPCSSSVDTNEGCELVWAAAASAKSARVRLR